MNGRPFYELEGGGEDVYLYYYHDGKKNRYWLISKYVRIKKIETLFTFQNRAWCNIVRTALLLARFRFTVILFIFLLTVYFN